MDILVIRMDDKKGSSLFTIIFEEKTEKCPSEF